MIFKQRLFTLTVLNLIKYEGKFIATAFSIIVVLKFLLKFVNKLLIVYFYILLYKYYYSYIIIQNKKYNI